MILSSTLKALAFAFLLYSCQAIAEVEIANPASAEEEKADRLEHEQSQLFKMAKTLGFDDYIDIIDIPLRIKELGVPKLKKMLVFIEDDIGRDFSAIQVKPPYVVYGVQNNLAKKYERIAVQLPNVDKVRRGSYINHKSLYSFVTVLEVTGIDGFKSPLAVVKPLAQSRYKFTGDD